MKNYKNEGRQGFAQKRYKTYIFVHKMSTNFGK